MTKYKRGDIFVDLNVPGHRSDKYLIYLEQKQGKTYFMYFNHHHVPRIKVISHFKWMGDEIVHLADSDVLERMHRLYKNELNKKLKECLERE